MILLSKTISNHRHCMLPVMFVYRSVVCPEGSDHPPHATGLPVHDVYSHANTNSVCLLGGTHCHTTAPAQRLIHGFVLLAYLAIISPCRLTCSKIGSF